MIGVRLISVIGDLQNNLIVKLIQILPNSSYNSHLGSSSNSSTVAVTSSPSQKMSDVEPRLSSSSCVNISMSTCVSIDSFNSWWMNLPRELCRNIAIGVRCMKADGLRGSKLESIRSIAEVFCWADGGVFCFITCKDAHKDSGKKECKLFFTVCIFVYTDECLQFAVLLTSQIVISLTLLSSSGMLLVVILVMRLPMLKSNGMWF